MVDAVQVGLPGRVKEWLDGRSFTLVKKDHRPGEQEWRMALHASTRQRYGRGARYMMMLSPEAATELIKELRRHADNERVLARHSIEVRALDETADRIENVLKRAADAGD